MGEGCRFDGRVDHVRHSVAPVVSLSLIRQINAEPGDLNMPPRFGPYSVDVCPGTEASQLVASLPINRNNGFALPLPQRDLPDPLRDPPLDMSLVTSCTAIEVRD
jgi:hypothetical protein